MPHLLLLITLITIVYSWEQIKEVAAVLLARLFKRRKLRRDYARIDSLVGTILIIATLPITLTYWVVDQGLGLDKLLVIIIEFLLAGSLLLYMEGLDRKHRRNQLHSAVGLAWGLLARPIFTLTQPSHDRKIIAKLVFTACLPLALAAIIKTAVRTPGIDLQIYIDHLTLVATMGFILLISIELLEKLFRTHHLPLSAYLRIALGVVLIAILARPW